MTTMTKSVPVKAKSERDPLFDELGFPKDPDNLYLQTVSVMLNAADLLEMPHWIKAILAQPQSEIVRLRCIEIGIIGSQAQLVGKVPTAFQFDAGPAARLAAVFGTRDSGAEIKRVYDLIGEMLAIGSDGAFERTSPIADRSFEPA